jgi:hypothetical protein
MAFSNVDSFGPFKYSYEYTKLVTVGWDHVIHRR